MLHILKRLLHFIKNQQLLINKNNQYEQTKNTTGESKRALRSRKHQTPLRIYYCMRGIYYYCNPSKHLTMTPIELYINTLEIKLLTMPNDGYVKETVQACLDLAKGINEIYEINNYDLSNQPN